MKKFKCTYEHVAEKTKRHGWFREHLWILEGVINGRWPYWLAICMNGTIGKLPEWEIPQIEFISSPENTNNARVNKRLSKHEKGSLLIDMIGTSNEAYKHVLNIFERCLRHGGYLQQLIDWWLYAFGSPRVLEKPKIDKEAEILLYSEFELHRFIGNPADWGALIGLEFLGGCKKGTAWFPTPIHLAHLMAEISFGDGDNRTKSISDPCVGTGVFLLVSSNHSLDLCGVDIDPLMVSLCEFAGWLFMPWLVYGNKRLIKEFRKEEQSEIIVEHSNDTALPQLKPNQGQGILFPEFEEITV